MKQLFIILIVVALCSTVAIPLSLILLHGIIGVVMFIGLMLIAGFAWSELLLGDWDF